MASQAASQAARQQIGVWKPTMSTILLIDCDVNDVNDAVSNLCTWLWNRWIRGVSRPMPSDHLNFPTCYLSSIYAILAQTRINWFFWQQQPTAKSIPCETQLLLDVTLVDRDSSLQLLTELFIIILLLLKILVFLSLFFLLFYYYQHISIFYHFYLLLFYY